MRKKIQRSKTQKKDSQKILPQLKIPYRLMTIQNFFINKDFRKLSSTINKKQSTRKQRIQIIKEQKYVDQNYMQLITGKQSVKISKKKFHNESMTIQQIMVNSFSPSKPTSKCNIIDFGSDQYQGLRDYNQDRVLICNNFKVLGKVYNFFGVFDGHGGYVTSQFVKSNFVKTFEEQIIEYPLLEILQILRKTIFKLQNRLAQLSKVKSLLGGTCASVLIISQNQYYIVHLGDSRILYIKSFDNFQFQQITTDHKPDEKSQKMRIESAGGKIYRNKVTLKDHLQAFGPYRVLPGKLSVSRTIGDFQAKNQPYGNSITCQPELLSGRIQQKSMFLLFTDGAYEKFQNSEIVQYFKKQNNQNQIQIRKCIQSYLINSILKQTTDNISIISVIVKPADNILSNI